MSLKVDGVELNAIGIELLPGNEGNGLRDDGPHNLARSHLLDAVFSDAYHAGLDELAWHGGRAGFTDLVLTGTLTLVRPSGRRGLILLGACPEVVDADRVYWIQSGWRSAYRGWPRPGWKRVSRYRLFSARSRWWGVPIRIAGVLSRPDWVDRSMARMRQDFGLDGVGRAYYTLSIWQPQLSPETGYGE